MEQGFQFEISLPDFRVGRFYYIQPIPPLQKPLQLYVTLYSSDRIELDSFYLL